MSTNVNDIELKCSAEAVYAPFAGSPELSFSLEDVSDNEGYVQVKATGVDDKGGIVWRFPIPNNVKSLVSVKVTGKVEVGTDALNIRIFDSVATQVASGSTSSTTKATVTLTSFSPTPALTPGTFLKVEAEASIAGVGDSGRIGSCAVEFQR